MHTHGVQGKSAALPFLPLPLVPQDPEAPAVFSLEPFVGGVDPDGSRGREEAEEKQNPPREASGEEEPTETSETFAAGELLPAPPSTPLVVYNRSGMMQSRPASGGQIRASG